MGAGPVVPPATRGRPPKVRRCASLQGVSGAAVQGGENTAAVRKRRSFSRTRRRASGMSSGGEREPRTPGRGVSGSSAMFGGPEGGGGMGFDAMGAEMELDSMGLPEAGISISVPQHSGGGGGGSGGRVMAGFGFVNFTQNDSGILMTGVAPSGSSKTKARREKEAAEKKRKMKEEIVKAVRAAGGVVDVQRLADVCDF